MLSCRLRWQRNHGSIGNKGQDRNCGSCTLRTRDRLWRVTRNGESLGGGDGDGDGERYALRHKYIVYNKQPPHLLLLFRRKMDSHATGRDLRQMRELTPDRANQAGQAHGVPDKTDTPDTVG